MKKILLLILMIVPVLILTNNSASANQEVIDNTTITGDQQFIDELNITFRDFNYQNKAAIRFNRDVTNSSFEGMEAIIDISNYNLIYKGTNNKTELYEANYLKFRANNKKVDAYIDTFKISDVSNTDHTFSLLKKDMIMVRFFEMEYHTENSWARKIKYIVAGDSIGQLDPVAFENKVNYNNVIYSDVDLTNEINTDYVPDTLTFNVYHQYEFIENTSITLSYDVLDGEAIASVDIMLTDGEGIKVQDLSFELPTPIKEGFEFMWWEVKDTFDMWQQVNQNTTLNTDTTFRAKYREIEDIYRVTFFPLLNEHDHTDEYWSFYKFSGLTIEVDRGDLVAEKTGPIKNSNYQELFIGWSTHKTSYIEYDFNAPVTKHTNLYAHYEKIDRAVINYESNGGYLLDDQVRYPFNVEIEYNIPEKARHAFDGWYLDHAFTIKAPTVLDWEDKSTHEMTLYAKWIDNSGTLFFETNGGSEISPIVIGIGQRVILPTYPPKRQGYSFKGWFLDNQLTRLVPDFFEFEDTTTIHAGWERNTAEELPEETEDKTIMYVAIGAAVILGFAIFGGKKRW